MNKRLNKILSLFLTGLIMNSSFTLQATPLPNPVTVTLDDKVIGTGYISKDGSTMIPLRVLSETLKYSVSWDSKEQEAIISNENRYIKLAVGYHSATVNESWIQLSSVPEMINNTVYVPLRVVADTMGLGVGYVNRTAYISSAGNPINLPTANKQIPMSELPSLFLSNGYERFDRANIDYIRYERAEGEKPYQIAFAQVVPDLNLVTLSMNENNKVNLDFTKLLLKSVVPTKADEIYEVITTQSIIPLQVFESDGYKVAIQAKENYSSLDMTIDGTPDGEFIKKIK